MRAFKLNLPKRLFTNAGKDVVDLESVFATKEMLFNHLIPAVQFETVLSPEVTYTTHLSTFENMNGVPAVGLNVETDYQKGEFGFIFPEGFVEIQLQISEDDEYYGSLLLNSIGVVLYGEKPSNVYTKLSVIPEDSYLEINGENNHFIIRDEKETKSGLRYAEDYNTDLLEEDRAIVDVAGVKILRQQANTWDTDGRPADPTAGTMGFNTQTNKFEGFDGTDWVQFH